MLVTIFSILTIVGRLCERQESAAVSSIRDTCGSKESYIAELTKLELECGSGQPGTFTLRTDKNTPKVLYYQVNEVIHCNVTKVMSMLFCFFQWVCPDSQAYRC